MIQITINLPDNPNTLAAVLALLQPGETKSRTKSRVEVDDTDEDNEEPADDQDEPEQRRRVVDEDDEPATTETEDANGDPIQVVDPKLQKLMRRAIKVAGIAEARKVMKKFGVTNLPDITKKVAPKLTAALEALVAAHKDD